VATLRAFAQILVTDDRAPTTVREAVRVRDDHLADALVALELQVFRAAADVADIGAGAGIPGIPLAIALPGVRIALLEGNGRKCDFLREVVEALLLQNVSVVNARAETWREGIGAFDVVTARALAPPDVVEEYAAPLLKVGGSLVAWRGRRDPEMEAAAARAAEALGMSAAEPRRVWPYPGAEHRFLHVVTKTGETPARFPRRDGVARKRPLGRP
jgi:16S rRNA (guanine527-N7)-methyltransferase